MAITGGASHYVSIVKDWINHNEISLEDGALWQNISPARLLGMFTRSESIVVDKRTWPPGGDGNK
jgi:hypothetical protein